MQDEIYWNEVRRNMDDFPAEKNSSKCVKKAPALHFEYIFLLVKCWSVMNACAHPVYPFILLSTTFFISLPCSLTHDQAWKEVESFNFASSFMIFIPHTFTLSHTTSEKKEGWRVEEERGIKFRKKKRVKSLLKPLNSPKKNPVLKDAAKWKRIGWVKVAIACILFLV